MNFKLSTLAAAIGLLGALLVPPTAHAQAHPEIMSAPVEPSSLPAQELTAETLFMVLLAEIAGARGEIAVSTDAYLRAARLTRDPRIARRATEIALYSRDTNAAAEAARLWAEIEPESNEARRVLAGVLATSGERLNEVQIQLARILAGSPEQLEQNLLGLNRALARVPDRQTVRSIVDRLTEPYLKEPSAHFARAQVAISVEDGIGAVASLEEALRLRPDWEPAVLLKSQLLVQLGATRDAMTLLEAYLRTHPDSTQARLAYARTLVSAREFEKAHDAFQGLLDESPEDRDLLYAVALVSAQIGNHDEAIDLFERALDGGHPETDHIRMNLGHLTEQRNRVDDALGWYRAVEDGPQYLDAQIRIAVLLARQGHVDAARLHLRSLETGEEDARRMLFAETLVLREGGRYAQALELVDRALLDDPDSTELLYESAMLAERLDELQLMEARLRKLIALDPEHAHAYNALGYSLAERGIRLDEAEELIVRALELSPDDPFILDSLGWVRYRMSDLEGALGHLERAYELRPDPEIAAHLGEVLWTLERRDEADRIWEEALRDHPGNDTLRATIERLLQR
ncbi:tetratricopeptide repeat protein [Rhodocyclaceae bacterium SMB388]